MPSDKTITTGDELRSGSVFAVRRFRELYGGIDSGWNGFSAFLHPYRFWWLALSLLIVAVPFLISHLPFFLYYPLPFIQPDSGGYWGVVWMIESGKLPVFNYRTPGYPLFMHFCYVVFGPKVLNVIAVQCVIALLASLTLTVCVFKSGKRLLPLLPLAAFAMSVFQFDNASLAADFAPLTESLFSSCMIFAFAFASLAIFRGWWPCFALASVFMLLSVAVRPTGQFLCFSYVLGIVFLLFNRARYGKAAMLSFILPFPIMMMAWLSYNKYTFGHFKLTDGFEMTLLCGVSPYLEESSAYSPELNAAIRKINARVTPEDKAVIRGSSLDWRKTAAVYYKCPYWNVSEILGPVVDPKIPEFKELGQIGIFKKLGQDAIKRNFKTFLRVYYMNLCLYFIGNMEWHLNSPYDGLQETLNSVYVKRHYQTHLTEAEARSFLHEYYDAESLPATIKVKVEDAASGKFAYELEKRNLASFQNYLYRHFFKSFRKTGWVYASFLVCFASGVVTLLALFRNSNAFVILFISSSAIGHGMICSIFSNTPRFSEPTTFIYYLSIALAPLLLIKPVFPERPSETATTASD